MKGTKEYEEIIDEITKVNYAHQIENDQAESKEIKDNDDKENYEIEVDQNPDQIKNKQQILKVEDDNLPTTPETPLGQGWKRIFAYYYQPYAWSMMIVSFFSSGVWPLMGLLLANMMFSLIGLTFDPEVFKP